MEREQANAIDRISLDHGGWCTCSPPSPDIGAPRTVMVAGGGVYDVSEDGVVICRTAGTCHALDPETDEWNRPLPHAGRNRSSAVRVAV